MIIECENCESKFRLDESLLKPAGSRVRCSLCRYVFIAYPPQEEPLEEIATDQMLEEGLEETWSIESGPGFGEEEAGPVEKEADSDFDLAFEEAMEEAEVREVAAPEEIPEPEAEEIVVGETEDLAREEPEEGLEAAVVAAPERKPGQSRVLPLILVIILLIVGGAAAVFYFAPDLIPDSIPFLKPSKSQEATDPGVARLSFKAVTGSFTQSDKAGQLFVIKGMVTNNYPKPRSFISIKGSILDDKGKVVKINIAYAGNTFTEKQIKEMPLEELHEGLKNRFGRRRMNFNLQPGGTIPFMIILEKLPENVSEFTVEAVSSSAGK